LLPQTAIGALKYVENNDKIRLSEVHNLTGSSYHTLQCTVYNLIPVVIHQY